MMKMMVVAMNTEREPLTQSNNGDGLSPPSNNNDDGDNVEIVSDNATRDECQSHNL